MIMDLQRNQEDEYELQYYDFNSKDFISAFEELLLTTIKEGIDDLEKTLTCSQNLLPKHFQDLFHEYKILILDCSTKIESAIRNYIAIPKHVVLPEDKDNVPCTKLELENIHSEIKELEEMYKKERAFNYLCRKELEILSSFETLSNKVKHCIENSKYNTEVEGDLTHKLLKVHKELSSQLSVLDVKYKAEI